MIRLSLIIATYNRAAQLVDTLRSVVAQEADPATWECVVVDNNSQDDTAARFAAFAAAHSGFRLRRVFEPRQGLSHARNRGIAESCGELVAIIDDDERIVPGFIGSYIAFFDARPDASVAGGPIVAEYPSGRPVWMSRWIERPIANPMDFGREVRSFPADRIPGGGNMAFRRSVVDRFGAFDPALGRTGKRLIGGEETDFFDRLRRGGERIWYVPGAVMYHIIPPEKLTDAYFRRLCYNVGVSQRLQAGEKGRRSLRLREACKWLVTFALLFTMRPAQGRQLLRMRREIGRGVFSREE